MKSGLHGFKVLPVCTAMLFFVLTVTHAADSVLGMHQEIDHLLKYVEESDCTFIRNGREKGADPARAHIERKYEYFKDRVQTTEDFIKYAATKSTMSGKRYKIRCNGHEMYVSDWLYTELQRLRIRQQDH